MSKTTIHWNLIAFLSIITFIRPLLSILGISEAIGKPVTSISATLLITIVWIYTVVKKQVSQPFLTLLLVGIGYGLLAIVTSGILSPILTGQLQGPLTHPLAMISVLITNAIWGAFSGGIASIFLKRTNH